MQGMHTRPNSYRLRRGRYSESGRAYLVTAVTHQRRPVFANWKVGRLLVAELKRVHDAGLVNSLAWVVMPDHFHWLLQLQNGHLSGVIGATKARCTHRVNSLTGTSGPLWQSGFHDRAIRDNEELRSYAHYIIMNPLRAGLVERIGDYPLWDAEWL
jgi:putative transposase